MKYSVVVYAGNVEIERFSDVAEQAAQKIADIMQDKGYKVRMIAA